MEKNLGLLPCPCCGGEAKIIFDNDGDGDEYSFVECQKCGVQTPGFYSYPGEPYGWEKAKQCWNKRVSKERCYEKGL